MAQAEEGECACDLARQTVLAGAFKVRHPPPRGRLDEVEPVVRRAAGHAPVTNPKSNVSHTWLKPPGNPRIPPGYDEAVKPASYSRAERYPDCAALQKWVRSVETLLNIKEKMASFRRNFAIPRLEHEAIS